MADVLEGYDAEGWEWFCEDVYNSIKNHWRSADPCTDLTGITPGMIVSRSSNEKLYHRQAATCKEILQADTPFSDNAQIIGGDGSDAILIPYEELTNDAVIWGLPLSPKRGLILCDVADIAANFTALISASAYPQVSLVDLDIDSMIQFGFTADDKPTAVFRSGAYYSLLQQSQAEGLAGADLRIGLDESLRSIIILDRGDINQDLGLVASGYSAWYIFDADYDSYVALTHRADDTPTLISGGADIGLNIQAAGKNLGFFDVAPVVRQAHIANATGAGDVVLRVNSILLALENYGLLNTV